LFGSQVLDPRRHWFEFGVEPGRLPDEVAQVTSDGRVGAFPCSNYCR